MVEHGRGQDVQGRGEAPALDSNAGGCEADELLVMLPYRLTDCSARPSRIAKARPLISRSWSLAFRWSKS